MTYDKSKPLAVVGIYNTGITVQDLMDIIEWWVGEPYPDAHVVFPWFVDTINTHHWIELLPGPQGGHRHGMQPGMANYKEIPNAVAITDATTLLHYIQSLACDGDDPLEDLLREGIVVARHMCTCDIKQLADEGCTCGGR